MINRSLIEIEKMTGGHGLKQQQSKIIQGVSIDTRSIKPGQLYVPIKGERFDGHDFIQKAVAAGAAAALWHENQPLPEVDIPLILVADTVTALQRLAREYRLQLKLKVVGITGSNGKTSTKDILAGILTTRYRTKKTFGNLNNHLGVPLTLLELEEDTEMAVVEMGISDPGEMAVLTSIALPDAAIITNIGEAHLTTMGTKENIYNEKLKIVEGLRPEGIFVYNGDDDTLGEKVEALALPHRVEAFGQKPHNSYRPTLKALKENGSLFVLEGKAEKPMLLPMLGRHQIYNAAAAIAVARFFGLSYEDIRTGLLGIDPTGMRNELIKGKGFTILNDAYKSNPSSLRAALDTLYGLEGYSQKIAVLGNMEGIGDDEVEFHREIGREIDPDEIDYLFTIGPLAKSLAETAAPRFPKDRVRFFTNREDMLKAIQQVLSEHAIILVKASRGLQLELVIEALLQQEDKAATAIM